MNLLRTAAILEPQRSKVNVLEATLRPTRDRFTAREVTRTDVAQVESRLASGRSQLSQAESNYVTAQAQYLRVGVPPRTLESQPAQHPGSDPPSRREPIRAVSVRRAVVVRNPPAAAARKAATHGVQFRLSQVTQRAVQDR